MRPENTTSQELLIPQLIETIDTVLLDIPLVRPHKFSVLTIESQSVLLVRITTNAGVVGIGEGVVPGGPWWGGESVEGMQAIIDRYIAPLLIGQDAMCVGHLSRRMQRVAAGAPFARSAIDMALWDACGKSVGLPVWQLLGGRHRAEIPVTWALGADSVDAVIAEATTKLESGQHSRFKLKMGATEPAADVARVSAIVESLGDRALFSVDLNASWDEATARRWLPALDAAGVDIVEQPLPSWNLSAAARLRDQHRLKFMADESVLSVSDAHRVADAHAADIFSVKVAKCGGLTGVQRVATIAESHGIACFGGTTIETSIGTAAATHVFCSLPDLTAGCELFGPLLLADDIVENPTVYASGNVILGEGPGLGIAIDEDKVAKYARR